MNKKMYSLVLPIWLLLVSGPVLWILILTSNFFVATIVLIIACHIFKLKNVLKIYKRSIVKMVLYGFVSDAIGVSVLLLMSKINPDGLFTNVASNPTSSWVTTVFISICVAFSAWFAYFFHHRLTFRDLKVSEKKKKQIAVFLAIFTAPYLFFYPVKNVNINNKTQVIDDSDIISKKETDNMYIGNTMVTRVFAESENYTNSNFEYNEKINKVSSEIKSDNKSLVTTQVSANFDDSDISGYEKWAKQCSVIVFVKDANINTINVNLLNGNNSNNTISNLTFERKNIESEFGIKLEELQDDSSKLQIVLDRIKQGE